MEGFSLKSLAILCGGISGEHEISLISCRSILNAIDSSRFQAHLIYIRKNREIHLLKKEQLLNLPSNPKEVKELTGTPLDFRPYSFQGKKPGFFDRENFYEVDVALPILHGVGGEDGSIQGFFETAGIPVVGCSLTSSALGMDKALAKKICRMDGLPIVPFVEVREDLSLDESQISFPCFVKPALGGSSLGITKVSRAEDLVAAIKEARQWSPKVMIEPAIEGRELEIAVFRDEKDFIASPAGEIVCRPGEFYSYDAKYVEKDAAKLIAPAELTLDEQARLQHQACQVFESLGCWGMARVDFFMTKTGEFLLNEVNTIPGFTPISMYPRLMQLSGLEYSSLLSRLIDTAR